MPQSYTNFVYHFIFSTKRRRPWLTRQMRPRLFAYIGGICKRSDAVLLGAGGHDDHVHLLVRLHPETSPAEAMEKIKANSTSWLKTTYPALNGFAWQKGYTGFSVSRSVVPAVRGYLAKQEEHHKRVSFLDELDVFLAKHGMKRRKDDDD